MNFKGIITKISVAVLTITLTSCASVINGTYQNIDFKSDPLGAKIYIDGKNYGETPTSISLKRIGRLKGESTKKKEYQIKMVLDGYNPYEFKITRKLSGWFFGNILLGGIVGFIVDGASGSMYILTPEQIIATMSKETAYIQHNDDNILIAVSLDINPEWVKIGQLSKISN